MISQPNLLQSPATQEVRETVEHRLELYLTSSPGVPSRLLEAMKYSVLAPGKRLRPLLAIAASRLCGGDDAAALPAACAVELIHCYSLIHDDLPAMDDDDLRRGLPTCHRKFDEATAILAGDALIPLAFEILAKDIRPTEIALRCCYELAVAAGATQLVGGQSDDLSAENGDIDLEKLEKIHLRKTAAMLAVSLKLGALCAQATPEQVNCLEQFGKNLGLAFQISDDLLDLKGEQDKMGKRVGKDHVKGKLTYPAALGVSASEEMASQLIADAVASLNGFGSQAEPLIELANFVISRTR